MNMNSISKKINKSFHKDLDNIINSPGFTVYYSVLKEELHKDTPNYENLIQYGVLRLPDEDSRPNKELASYFQIIAEIKNIPEEIRDYAMDAMLYCESDKHDLVTKNLEELKKGYSRSRDL